MEWQRHCARGGPVKRPGAYEIWSALLEYPPLPWADFPNSTKVPFILTCFRFLAARVGVEQGAMDWAAPLVSSGYDHECDDGKIADALYEDGRVGELPRAIVLAFAREPRQRIRNQIVLKDAIASRRFVSWQADGPTCSEIGDVGKVGSPYMPDFEMNILPPAFCNQPTCNCEWTCVDVPDHIQRSPRLMARFSDRFDKIQVEMRQHWPD